MNRKQRRAQRNERIETVDLRAVVMPRHMTKEECRDVALYRLGRNRAETGHPLHHLTASNVIVNADPTLEYCLSRLDADDARHLRDFYRSQIRADAPKGVPVNRKYYGHDPYQVN